jgi:hypothetical protein
MKQLVTKQLVLVDRFQKDPEAARVSNIIKDVELLIMFSAMGNLSEQEMKDVIATGRRIVTSAVGNRGWCIDTIMNEIVGNTVQKPKAS